MRDNLTALLNTILFTDQNDVLGPFSDRLSTAISQTETLLTFVSIFGMGVKMYYEQTILTDKLIRENGGVSHGRNQQFELIAVLLDVPARH